MAMTTKEKALAYDKALQVLHKYDGANIMFSQALKEEMFPELKESEDERIRKFLLYHFGNKTKKEWNGMPVKDILAWLEKQEEQKPADKIEPKFKVGDKIQFSNGCGTIMTIEKIENGEYVFANNMGRTTIEWGNKWYLVERNPTWSEENE